jgi:hypothetical protein
VIIGPVLVVNNESAIKVKAGAQFNPRPGDKIELSQTAITGANAATVRAVSSTPSTGGIIKVITLDRPVTGITSTATVNGVPCVDASARPQSIAPITFSQSGCEIFAKIDRSFTSSPNFPPGNRVETGGCDRQSYCYDLSLVFDDGTVLPISGLLVL